MQVISLPTSSMRYSLLSVGHPASSCRRRRSLLLRSLRSTTAKDIPPAPPCL